MKLWRNLASAAVFASCVLVAQQSLAERVRGKAALSDSSQVLYWIQKGNAVAATSPGKAYSYAVNARRKSAEIGFFKGEGLALKSIGLIYYLRGRYVEALNYWEEAREAFKKGGDKGGVANMLSNIGVVYFLQGDDERALEKHLEALRLAELLNDDVRLATTLNNIGSVYFNKKATQAKALNYFLKVVPIAEKLGANGVVLLGAATANIGEIYLGKGDLKSALNYFKRSLAIDQGEQTHAFILNKIGETYQKQEQFELALTFHRKALAIARPLDAKLDMAQSFLMIASCYEKAGDISKAINNFQDARLTALGISNSNHELKSAYEGLARTFAASGNFKEAFTYKASYAKVKDELYNLDTDKKLAGLQFNFDLEKKQGEIDLLTKDKALKESDLRRQRLMKNALMIGLSLLVVITVIVYRNYRTKNRLNKILDGQKSEIEGLLLNILPAEVAEELKREGVAQPRFFESATVLFTDFKSFTRLADALSPQEVVLELNVCFMAFDDIIEKYGLEKIKTIGDSYMCAGGIPVPSTDHTVRMIYAALEIRDFIRNRNIIRTEMGLPPWDLRIGIHTGPLVAGVVGRKKYAYDIWGSTVNIASRMESNGEPGQVNVSAAVYDMIKDLYKCIHRGKISAKNIGEIDMYFVDQEILGAMAITESGELTMGLVSDQ